MEAGIFKVYNLREVTGADGKTYFITDSIFHQAGYAFEQEVTVFYPVDDYFYAYVDISKESWGVETVDEESLNTFEAEEELKIQDILDILSNVSAEPNSQ